MSLSLAVCFSTSKNLWAVGMSDHLLQAWQEWSMDATLPMADGTHWSLNFPYWDIQPENPPQHSIPRHHCHDELKARWNLFIYLLSVVCLLSSLNLQIENQDPERDLTRAAQSENPVPLVLRPVFFPPVSPSYTLWLKNLVSKPVLTLKIRLTGEREGLISSITWYVWHMQIMTLVWFSSWFFAISSCCCCQLRILGSKEIMLSNLTEEPWHY